MTLVTGSLRQAECLRLVWTDNINLAIIFLKSTTTSTKSQWTPGFHILPIITILGTI